MESHTVIVEVDERQHKQYDLIDEVSRMQQLHKSLGTPTIFIRFNPGVYTDEYKKKHDPCWGVNSSGEFVPGDEKEWNHRLHTLKTCISKHKDMVPNFWHQTFLFFDGDDDARGNQAKAFVTALENIQTGEKPTITSSKPVCFRFGPSETADLGIALRAYLNLHTTVTSWSNLWLNRKWAKQYANSITQKSGLKCGEAMVKKALEENLLNMYSDVGEWGWRGGWPVASE
jgi:hypothetical protein